MKVEKLNIRVPEGWDKINCVAIKSTAVVVYYEQNGDKKMRTYKIVED